MGGEAGGKTIAILGLTFKPNTDDMRDAPSLDIVPALLAAGAEVCAYDPEGRHEAETLLPAITYAEGAYECVEGADALVILTEWDEFRALDLARVKALMRGRVVVDLRNIYRPDAMQGHGFDYTGIGRSA
jgi:UDPglucose 6-dehydrogenase